MAAAVVGAGCAGEYGGGDGEVCLGGVGCRVVVDVDLAGGILLDLAAGWYSLCREAMCDGDHAEEGGEEEGEWLVHGLSKLVQRSGNDFADGSWVPRCAIFLVSSGGFISRLVR